MFQFLDENPIDKIFDFEENPEVEIKSFMIGTVKDRFFAQIDSRLAPILALQSFD